MHNQREKKKKDTNEQQINRRKESAGIYRYCE